MNITAMNTAAGTETVQGKALKVNVMVDLETLGTSPGDIILSLGACTFLEPECTDVRRTFYTTIDMNSSAALGLSINTGTLKWWMDQEKDARDEAFKGERELTETLMAFSMWLTSLEGTPVLWGNAASFDLKMLEAAYDAAGLETPWEYRNEMCFRTLKKLNRHVDEPVFPGIRHSAIMDALHQAAWAEKILRGTGVANG